MVTGAWERIKAIVDDVKEKCRDLPGPSGRRTAVTVHNNPAGLYSQPTVEWLASLPSGKVSRYWALKKIDHDHLVRQQGRMNFPDLMEMRVWTILFRHADLIWSRVESLWLELSRSLDTPYPFSNPEFIEEPDRMMRECRIGYEPDESIIPRMKQFQESITRVGELPARWNISHDLGLHGLGLHDLGMNGMGWRAIADQGILGGEPHLLGTNTTLREVWKVQKPGELNLDEIADKLQLGIGQADEACTVNSLLATRGGPFKLPAAMIGP